MKTLGIASENINFLTKIANKTLKIKKNHRICCQLGLSAVFITIYYLFPFNYIVIARPYRFGKIDPTFVVDGHRHKFPQRHAKPFVSMVYLATSSSGCRNLLALSAATHFDTAPRNPFGANESAQHRKSNHHGCHRNTNRRLQFQRNRRQQTAHL